MYILTLIKKSNQKIGRLSPLVKEVEECDQLYKNLVEAKIQVRGPCTQAWISGTPTCLCSSALERILVLGAGCCCEIAGVMRTVFKVPSHTVFKRRGLSYAPRF